MLNDGLIRSLQLPPLTLSYRRVSPQDRGLLVVKTQRLRAGRGGARL